MSDPSSQPTQPLTDERAERANERADALDMAAVAWKYSDESVSMKPDVPGWLRRRAAALRSGTADEQQSEVDRLRAENTAQAATLAAVRAPHKPSAFKVFGRTYCEACGQDAGVWPTVTDRALGLDQDGEGQANG